MGDVPFARRSLLAEPRRLIAGAVGVGLALMLVLLVNGLWAGVKSQVTKYEEHTGAQLYVVEPGTHALFADASRVPISRLGEVRATPGVTWASPVRTLFTIVDLHDKKVAASVVGYLPGERGGPWNLRSGREPRADDEVVVDRVLADRHDLHIGARLTLANLSFRVVGISGDTAGFMTSFVFLTHAATDRLLQAPETTSAVLVGTRTPTVVRRRLTAAGMTVLDDAELRAEGLRLATKIYGVPLRAMVAVAFATGTLIIALTAYAVVAERRREFGIVKAMGASGRRLVGAALAQTTWVTGLGVVAAGVFAVAGRALITAMRPQFSIVYAPGDIALAVALAAAMALLGALVPARRLLRLDPATAYRSG